jgi:ankyrin repeat protein
MCIAASSNDTHKMQLYIEAGIPVTYGDYDGRTPLHVASSNHSEEMCRLLLGAGADRNAIDAFGNSPDLTWMDQTSSQRQLRERVNFLNLPQIEKDVSMSLSRSSTIQRSYSSMPFGR